MNSAEWLNHRTADGLNDEELDKYLDVAEHALAVSQMGKMKSTRKSAMLSLRRTLTHSSIQGTDVNL